jgi:taurine dioxygenase
MTMTTASTTIEVIPSGGPLGAEIRGVDLSRPMTPELFAEIERAWHDHIVLLFRGQKLDDAQLVAFGERFGQLHPAPHHEYGDNAKDLHWAVELISNVLRNGRPIGALGAGEATWHTDMSMYEIPASATILYAEEIPPSGGNTRFANLTRAYEELPERLRDAVDGRLSIHDHAYLASGGVRPGFTEVADKSQGPGARHPVVRTHPATGRKALYLGRRTTGYILGYPVVESDRLLDELWEHMTAPRYVWEHVWRVGDVLVWDNRQAVHARQSFPTQSRRVMRRITAMSEKPF